MGKPTYSYKFVMFILEFRAFLGKIEAPLTFVLGPGAFIRENTVIKVRCLSTDTATLIFAFVDISTVGSYASLVVCDLIKIQTGPKVTL